MSVTIRFENKQDLRLCVSRGVTIPHVGVTTGAVERKFHIRGEELDILRAMLDMAQNRNTQEP